MTDPNLQRLVQQLLSSLSERHAAIVAYRFGLDDGQTHTLDETSAKFGLDRVEIRRLELEAMGSIRAGGRGSSPPDQSSD